MEMANVPGQGVEVKTQCQAQPLDPLTDSLY